MDERYIFYDNDAWLRFNAPAFEMEDAGDTVHLLFGFAQITIGDGYLRVPKMDNCMASFRRVMGL